MLTSTKPETLESCCRRRSQPSMTSKDVFGGGARERRSIRKVSTAWNGAVARGWNVGCVSVNQSINIYMHITRHFLFKPINAYRGVGCAPACLDSGNSCNRQTSDPE